ncbi:alpha/beta hydrolase [Deinococcus sonorensis]|uniref:Alpha/beta hydrolase n=2 Tax=Deinococcus sonorensis TaxID=309891 RepID=A0AAU7U5E9_9DEIO
MTQFPAVRSPSVRPPTARRASLLRRLTLSAGLLAGVTLLGACNETRAEQADARAYPPPGRLVDVGGFRLHLECAGSGAPTVVIDAGLGAWSTPWHAVQGLVAGTTRVCTYDRAGLGYSEPGPLPRDAAHFAAELHTLLHRAALPGPYVLAGHSLGGLTMRVYAQRYPQDVAGLALLESMSPQPGAAAPTAASDTPGLPLLKLAARLGLVRLLSGPLGLSAGLPARDAGPATALAVTDRYFQTLSDETAGIPASLAQAGEVTTLGDLPLTVLSRGRNAVPAWTAGQARLLTLSSRTTQVTAHHSGHNVELDEPQAAADAIVALVRQLR